MAKLAMWTPGTAAFPGEIGLGQLENVSIGTGAIPRVIPYTDLVGFRSGSWTRFRMKPNQRHSFTIPISAPVLFPVPRLDPERNIVMVEQRTRIEKVILMFGVIGDAPTAIPGRLMSVQVHDGSRPPILTVGPLNVTGDFSVGIDGRNSWDIPGHPQVFWGISITATFESFRDAANIIFFSAGADFIVV